MKNKKGFLLLEKNALTLIVAIMCIILILVVVVHYFNIITSSQIKRNVQTSLDILEKSANDLKEGEKKIVKLPGLNRGIDVKNEKEYDEVWYITGWSKSDDGIKAPPEKYIFQNTICVCQSGYSNYKTRNIACQSINSCREIKGVSKIEIDNGFVYTGAIGDGFSPDKAILFASNLIEVEISKSNGVVTFKKRT